jgi:hypothetical protein
VTRRLILILALTLSCGLTESARAWEDANDGVEENPELLWPYSYKLKQTDVTTPSEPGDTRMKGTIYSVDILSAEQCMAIRSHFEALNANEVETQFGRENLKCEIKMKEGVVTMSISKDQTVFFSGTATVGSIPRTDGPREKDYYFQIRQQKTSPTGLAVVEVVTFARVVKSQ